MRASPRLTAAAALAVASITLPLHAQQARGAGERYTLRGDRVAVYNLVGTMRVEGAARGGDVEVEVRTGGPDGRELKVETGEIGGRQTLRVVYPDDDIHVPRDGAFSGSTTLHVRDDGTFGDDGYGSGSDDDDDDRASRSRSSRRSDSRSRRVRISSRGDGIEAYADVTLRVPEDRTIAVFLGVGEAAVSNVNGDITVDVSAAEITTDRTRGTLRLDTGSGAVTVTDAQGDVNLDTGSGGVRVRGVRGRELRIDTGSGSVVVDDVDVARLDVDVGSGGVRMTRVRAPDLRVDSGSGSVDVELASGATARNFLFDTGSGGVTLRVPETLAAELDISTGSGGITTDIPIAVTRRDRSSLLGRIGNTQHATRISS
jgi:lia operon protein LiaG